MQFVLTIAFLFLLAGCSGKGGGEKIMINVKKDSPIIKKEATINPYASVDLSPMDVSYFPEDYPILRNVRKNHINAFGQGSVQSPSSPGT
jgi:hypothetical protein